MERKKSIAPKMAFQSLCVLEKPLPHLALSDWNQRVDTLRNVADTRRAEAFRIRHSARALRNDTRIEGDWTNYETNEALTDRQVSLISNIIITIVYHILSNIY